MIFSPKKWKVAAQKGHNTNGLNLRKSMNEKLQKPEEENKVVTKDFNYMRAVINTLSPSLWEEGTKTIEDLKRQMVIMKEENIKVLKKNYISKMLCFK